MQKGNSIFSKIKSLLFFALLALIIAGYFFYPTYYQQILGKFSPLKCSLPIKYYIGTVDPRFGLSRVEFEKSVKKAVASWQNMSTSTLFVYSSSTDAMPISLVYDTRQAETQELSDLNQKISDGRATLDELKQAYTLKKQQYDEAKTLYQTHLSAYEAQVDSYTREVNSWNKKGGAPRVDYDRLNQTRESLSQTAQGLDQEAEKLNLLGVEVNRLATLANQSIVEINKNVNNYNSSDLIGREFEQGLYQVSGFEKSINIYQFSSGDKLYKVLVHELGHALSLGHNEDKKSIMYYINQDAGQVITKTDMTNIKNTCAKRDWIDVAIETVVWKPVIWLKTRLPWL